MNANDPIVGPWSKAPHPHRLAGAQHMVVVEPIDEPEEPVDELADDERWSWPSFAWGAAAGVYAGAMVTLAAAWVWSFLL